MNPIDAEQINIELFNYFTFNAKKCIVLVDGQILRFKNNPSLFYLNFKDMEWKKQQIYENSPNWVYPPAIIIKYDTSKDLFHKLSEFVDKNVIVYMYKIKIDDKLEKEISICGLKLIREFSCYFIKNDKEKEI